MAVLEVFPKGAHHDGTDGFLHVLVVFFSQTDGLHGVGKRVEFIALHVEIDARIPQEPPDPYVKDGVRCGGMLYHLNDHFFSQKLCFGNKFLCNPQFAQGSMDKFYGILHKTSAVGGKTLSFIGDFHSFHR